MKKKKKYLTKQQIQEIVEKYKTGEYTCTDLAKEYSKSVSTVSHQLKMNGVEVLFNQCIHGRRYSLNEHYFDIIDTEEKAYFLGLLYTDGNICTKQNNICITLQDTDKHILEKFAEELGSDRPLYFKKRREEHHHDYYKISINSKRIKERLIELGCHPNKCFTLKFPTSDQVPVCLLKHFIRGVWDGDGSFTLYRSKNKYLILSSRLTGTLDLCSGIKEYIKNELQLDGIVVFPKKCKGTTRELRYDGSLKPFKFLIWLYHNQNICLKRKFDKFASIQMIMTDEIESCRLMCS